MGSFKAPGPDGFQPVFYQRCWETVGDSVCRFSLQFFEDGTLPEGTNDAIVVLIPKVAKPERITQFRPISLCNVLFKIITKTLVGRLKPVMNKLIGPAQASFLPGRLSSDNIVIVQEAVHSFRRKQGRKGWMLLKLDLEKAYDRVRWDFLEDTLRAAGFTEVWVRRIMACVVGPNMNILWNGEKSDPFKPQRGLRQGDPLSPYLFVLCIERLCHLIDTAIHEKRWKPIKLSRGGPHLSHICFADDLILFAEASVAQVRVIRGVLERFCNASGQKVSLQKSKIFFSKNVTRELCAAISRESGIESTLDLGKYLGMPILQKRINKDTFGDVVEKVASRLTGWKKQTLSLAGRVTLTKSVLSLIPVHLMSTIQLPVCVLEKLDYLSRSFVWGGGQHLVAWDQVCMPRREGGLGVKNPRIMNKSLIAKVGWRLLTDKTSLWARVLRQKYRVGDIQDHTWQTARRPGSATWRSVVMGIREVVIQGQGWVIGNGQHACFWTDKWCGGEALVDNIVGIPPLGHENVRVQDMWLEAGGWDLHRISPFVTEEKQLELSAVVVDTVTGAQDRLVWCPTMNGEFTVRSAYDKLSQSMIPRPNMGLFYRRIWSVKVPERICTFLWLVARQAIMTNAERYRRHLSGTDICQVCKGAKETILHIVRDCPAIAGIWSRLVPLPLQSSFFSMTLFEWLYRNTGNLAVVGGVTWDITFAITVWWAWKWRCGNVFGETRLWRDRLKFIKNLANEAYLSSMAEQGERVPRSNVEIMVKWDPPHIGWMKLNTDGASHGNPGPATAGGVLRNSDGEWCVGFALNIGRCSASLAELWGVYYGLLIAWDRRVTQLVLEVDSKIVVEFLIDGIGDSHPLSFLVRLCHGLLSRDWIVRVEHVYREANCLADSLATYAFDFPLGLHSFEFIPEFVSSFYNDDFVGRAFARQIRV